MEIVRVTAAVPSAGTSVTRTLTRSVRERCVLSAARQCALLDLDDVGSTASGCGCGGWCRWKVVRRPTLSRFAVAGVDGGLGAQPLRPNCSCARTVR